MTDKDKSSINNNDTKTTELNHNKITVDPVTNIDTHPQSKAIDNDTRYSKQPTDKNQPDTITPDVVADPGITGQQKDNPTDIDHKPLDTSDEPASIQETVTEDSNLIFDERTAEITHGANTSVPSAQLTEELEEVIPFDLIPESSPVRLPPTITVDEYSECITARVESSAYQFEITNPFNFEQLHEGQAISESDVNTNDLGLIAIDLDRSVSLTFNDEHAGFKNSLGAVMLDNQGNLIGAQLLFTNTSLPGSGGSLDAGTTIDIAPPNGNPGDPIPAGSLLDLFVVANGYQLNQFLESVDLTQGTLSFIDQTTQQTANINTTSPENLQLIFTPQQGESKIFDGHIYFSGLTSLNPDGLEHTVYGAGDPAVDNDLEIGFEDLFGIKNSDRDFDDLVVQIHVSDAYTKILEPTPIAEDITITDPDSSQLSAATVSISSDTVQANDQLNLDSARYTVNAQGQIIDEQTLLPTGIQISGLDTGQLSLTGLASKATYELVLEAITLSTQADNTGQMTRTIEYQVTDDTALTSNLADIQLTIKCDFIQANDDLDMAVEGQAMTTGNVITGVDSDPNPDNQGTLNADETTSNQSLSVLAIHYTDVNGQSSSASLVNGQATVHTQLGGTLTIYTDGQYQYQPPTNVNNDPNQDGVQDTIVDHFSYTIANELQSQAQANLDIIIKDGQAPQAHDDIDSVRLGDTSGTIGNVITGIDADTNPVNQGTLQADNPGSDAVIQVSEIHYLDNQGQWQTQALDNGQAVVHSSLGGTLTIQADGQYQYIPPTSGNDALDQFQYTIVDTDGSTSTANLDIQIESPCHIPHNCTYRLSNHPDGAEASPFYGLRLDELVNVHNGTHDVFSFNFDALGAAMFLTYDNQADTIRIHGQAFGGLDISDKSPNFSPSNSSSIAGYDPNNAYTGFWDIDFTYYNVSSVAGDDDLQVLGYGPTIAEGTITSLSTGEQFDLFQHPKGMTETGLAFQLGDEANDNGHRGFEGISGWGWLDHAPAGDVTDGNPPHHSASDWLFTMDNHCIEHNMDPIAKDDSFIATPSQWLTINFADLLQNDVDPDQDPLTIIAIDQVQNGQAVINPFNQTIKVAADHVSQQISFEYTISDSQGGTDSAHVNISFVDCASNPLIYGLDQDNLLYVSKGTEQYHNETGSDHTMAQSNLTLGDVIHDFDKLSNNHDVLNLDALLDQFSIATEQRADSIELVEHDAGTQVMLDCNGDGCSDLLVVDIANVYAQHWSIGSTDQHDINVGSLA